MKFEHTETFNFKGAFKGLRNPLESWHKSDSRFEIVDTFGIDYAEYDFEVADAWTRYELNKTVGKEDVDWELWDNQYEELWEKYDQWLLDTGCMRYDGADRRHSYRFEFAFLGPNDLELAQKLVRAGTEHAKFMRQIFVSVDITAPLYWWKEFDTYKIGTTANSTSTMHKLTSAPITKECFEFDEEPSLVVATGSSPHGSEWEYVLDDYIQDFVDICEELRLRYIETKDKRYWRALIQLLPESWLQTRTVTMSYANLRNIYFQRRNHKLKEWHQFCDWIATLPWAGELIMLEYTNEIN